MVRENAAVSAESTEFQPGISVYFIILRQTHNDELPGYPPWKNVTIIINNDSDNNNNKFMSGMPSKSPFVCPRQK